MVCRVVLIDTKKDEVIRQEYWSDTYPECEKRVKKLNDKLESKGAKRTWSIREINC